MKYPRSRFLIVLKLLSVTESFHGPSHCSRFGPILPQGMLVSASSCMEVVKDSPSPEEEFDKVKRLCENALLNPGQPSCLRALEDLSQLCSQRKPYHFLKDNDCPEGSLLEKVHHLIPTETTEKIFEVVTKMQENGWLSTNPDSVDGLPSFHLNLISSGKRVFEEANPDIGDNEPGFEHHIKELIALVSPYIYEQLLPLTQQRLGTKDIQVSEVFLRQYGEAIIDGQSRHGISAHYDVFSRVTCVIALDDTAKDGRNGLYTTHKTLHADRSTSLGTTSNHRSLRRFFPLSCGDGVVHTWDVLHGVDVEPGVDRTSLIVWFAAGDEEETDKENVIPWLTKRNDLDTNPVAQFVLASGLESSEENLSGTKAHDLYIRSAILGNLFAITRLGSLCENDELAIKQRERVRDLLKCLEESSGSLPERFLSHELDTPLDLAKRLWWQGSMRGNPIAQVALADELMLTAMSQECADIDNHFILAGVLFALAAQQGNDHALESLHRIQSFEAALREINHPGKFDSLITRSIAKSAFAGLSRF